MTEEKMVENIKENPDKLSEPVLIIGTLPCMNQLMKSIWQFIRKPADQMAKLSGGEYTEHDVFRSIWYGQSFLYVGYMCDSKEDSEFAKKNPDNANLIVAKYVTMKREKDFIGYTIVRLDDIGPHIWQAYVAKEYRGTTAFDKCVRFVLDRLAEIGARRASFTSMRKGWGDKIEKMGFKEGPTTFYIELEPPDDSDNEHIMV